LIDKTLPPSVKYLITNKKNYTREVAMTKDELILSHRLSLLSRAKSINNISAACRQFGYPEPTTTNGLKDLPPTVSRGLLKEKEPNL